MSTIFCYTLLLLLLNNRINEVRCSDNTAVNFPSGHSHVDPHLQVDEDERILPGGGSTPGASPRIHACDFIDNDPGVILCVCLSNDLITLDSNDDDEDSSLFQIQGHWFRNNFSLLCGGHH